ncbi:MAG: hormogonium polysaccharide secretion pseudopilin HpsC [Spirulina sp.]
MFENDTKKSGHLALLNWLLLVLHRDKNRPMAIAGYTLIELLVAMIIAVLVISPLLGLAVNLLQTDRQEQAKATSEEELQLAADYIARDLKQAVYVYDAGALERVGSNDTNSGIQDQIPPGAPATGCNNTNTCEPVLVFWKRRPMTDVVPRQSTSDCDLVPTDCDDTFVFSLVAYYLILDDNANDVWSGAARIGRFELQDGVVDPFNPTLPTGGSNYLANAQPDVGFQLFNLSLSGSDLSSIMNRWRKDTPNYANSVDTLIDYIDRTPTTAAERTALENACPDDTIPDPSNPTETINVWSLSPSATNQADFPLSFHACVNNQDNAAIVYLRGNAFARIQLDDNALVSTENRVKAGYFPSVKTEVGSIGKLVP